jgi:hypothetical protein
VISTALFKTDGGSTRGAPAGAFPEPPESKIRSSSQVNVREEEPCAQREHWRRLAANLEASRIDLRRNIIRVPRWMTPAYDRFISYAITELLVRPMSSPTGW